MAIKLDRPQKVAILGAVAVLVMAIVGRHMLDREVRENHAREDREFLASRERREEADTQRRMADERRRHAEEEAARQRDQQAQTERRRFEAMTPAQHLAAAQSSAPAEAVPHLNAIPATAPESRAARRLLRVLAEAQKAAEANDRRAFAAVLDRNFLRQGIETRQVIAQGSEARRLYIDCIMCGRVFLDRFAGREADRAELVRHGFTSIRCDNGFESWDQPL